ncbi:MAG: hypothetical protein OXE97_00825, partial [Gammaproteobacteria bacterium]|nr:hypothetical protein [Gammaproteobacteria bacterium]
FYLLRFGSVRVQGLLRLSAKVMVANNNLFQAVTEPLTMRSCECASVRVARYYSGCVPIGKHFIEVLTFATICDRIRSNGVQAFEGSMKYLAKFIAEYRFL